MGLVCFHVERLPLCPLKGETCLLTVSNSCTSSACIFGSLAQHALLMCNTITISLKAPPYVEPPEKSHGNQQDGGPDIFSWLLGKGFTTSGVPTGEILILSWLVIVDHQVSQLLNTCYLPYKQTAFLGLGLFTLWNHRSPTFPFFTFWGVLRRILGTLWCGDPQHSCVIGWVRGKWEKLPWNRLRPMMDVQILCKLYISKLFPVPISDIVHTICRVPPGATTISTSQRNQRKRWKWCIVIARRNIDIVEHSTGTLERMQTNSMIHMIHFTSCQCNLLIVVDPEPSARWSSRECTVCCRQALRLLCWLWFLCTLVKRSYLLVRENGRFDKCFFVLQSFKTAFLECMDSRERGIYFSVTPRIRV